MESMNHPLIYVIITVGFLVVSTMIGTLGYFIRSRFDGIDNQLKHNMRTHDDCYATLTIRFADKESTRENLAKLWKRSDDHEGSIKWIESRLRGPAGDING